MPKIKKPPRPSPLCTPANTALTPVTSVLKPTAAANRAGEGVKGVFPFKLLLMDLFSNLTHVFIVF